MAALSAFAMSVVSMEQAMERGSCQGRGPLPGTETSATIPAVQRTVRTTRRATSHYNSFQTYCSPDHSPPPCYNTAVQQRQPSIRPEEGVEALPEYECTVSAEAKVLLNLELIHPMHTVSESEWREVYVLVRGTMLSIHRVKDGACGKLLRTYTLQHAEVGMALETTHTVLTPNTKLAHLIPAPARQKAFRKDPRLFKASKQHILRIRVETDQLLFAQSSEEATHNLVNAISAAIDISHPIDERSAARQCTVPRRRRRNRPQFNGDVNDPTMIAEQERILRQMYPSLAETRTEQTAQTPAREEDEIDVSAMREESPATRRPVMSRSSTQNSIESRVGDDMVFASDSSNFTADGKWQPAHTRTDAQALRYTRRCMPILQAEAPRASDILIYCGRRVKIDWRHESLNDWELKPPSYRSHGFESRNLERTASAASDQRLSQAESDITPLEDSLATLDLTKIVSGSPSIDKSQTARSKTRRVEIDTMTAMQGAVYCF